jgi:tripartite-type tricarboxylate transporter receptor subunit TctC
MRKFATVGAIISLLLFFLVNLIFSSTLDAQQHFYQGKSIRLIAGTQAGSLADLWPRLIADHMGKHIAGNPGIVVQNMPGAGGVIAANYVYNVAKPDGLTLGTASPSIYMDQIVGRKEIQFDWAKFNWIGTPEQYDYVFVMRGDSPFCYARG